MRGPLFGPEQPPNPSFLRRWGCFFSLVVVCVAVWFGVQWCKEMDSRIKVAPPPDLSLYLPVKARVIDQGPGDWKEFTMSDDPDINCFSICYEYDVNGTRYRNDRYSFAQQSYAVFADLGQSILARNTYAIGKEIVIYYNKNRPSDSVISLDIYATGLTIPPWTRTSPSALWDVFFWLSVLCAIVSIPWVWTSLNNVWNRRGTPHISRTWRF